MNDPTFALNVQKLLHVSMIEKDMKAYTLGKKDLSVEENSKTVVNGAVAVHLLAQTP